MPLKDKNVLKWTENGFEILKGGRLRFVFIDHLFKRMPGSQLGMQLVTVGETQGASEIRYYQPIIPPPLHRLRFRARANKLPC